MSFARQYVLFNEYQPCLFAKNEKSVRCMVTSNRADIPNEEPTLWVVACPKGVHGCVHMDTHTHTHTHTRTTQMFPTQTCSQIAPPFALMFQSSAMSISILSLIKFHLDERLYKGQEENSTHFSCVCVLMRSFIRYNQK